MTDTLDAIAREMQRTIDQHIFGSNDEVDSYLRGIVRKLYALSNQGEGAVAWDEGSPCVEPRPVGMVYPTKPAPRAYGYLDGSGVEWSAYDTSQLEAYARDAAASYYHIAEADRRDAERWRALVGSARVRVLGSAGLLGDIDPNGAPFNGYAHIGLELWTQHSAGNSPSDAVFMLTRYADIAATQEQT